MVAHARRVLTSPASRALTILRDHGRKCACSRFRPAVTGSSSQSPLDWSTPRRRDQNPLCPACKNGGPARGPGCHQPPPISHAAHPYGPCGVLVDGRRCGCRYALPIEGEDLSWLPPEERPASTDLKICEVCGRDYAGERTYPVDVSSMPNNPPLYCLCCLQCFERERERRRELGGELCMQGYMPGTHMYGVVYMKRLREWQEEEGYRR